ncbi:hypothetical protein MGLY_20620 [Neomoorella glycerini]|uniref:Uncharacterized protein n=1 Tax=Neomoorella glycerini TaxID=55779 RepID=A0A6I5ZRP6_9FIRM|nr:hypothetical protein [Moorella glycerini]QGP92674.1 hypothetical protein MGLY_20620 [Moorella glycerini]
MRPFIGNFAEPTKEKVFPFHFDAKKDVLVTNHLEPVVKSDLKVAELTTKTEVRREDDDDLPSFLTKTKIDREDDDDDIYF